MTQLAHNETLCDTIWLFEATVLHTNAVYLHVYTCSVIIIDYRSALHVIILMGGVTASETLIGGYICTTGGCSTPPQKQPKENIGSRCIMVTPT